MDRYIVKIGVWLAMLFALLLPSCNEDVTEIVTDYQRKNDAFVEVVSKDSKYTKLEFLHEGPIYYRVITPAPIENKDNKPLQNSKVSVYLRGVVPALQLRDLSEIKVLKDVTPLIRDGEVFQHRGDTPTPLWVQEKKVGAGGTTTLVKGMQVALQNMSIGDKWEVIIPWQMGYKGYTSIIPAFSTLVFEVELVDILEK